MDPITSLNKPKEYWIDRNKEFSRVRTQFMSHQEVMFYATLCLMLTHEWSEANTTAWTNGIRAGYHPDFWASLDEEERLGLLFHEMDHVAKRHMARLRDFDAEKFNRACDYNINIGIDKAGFKLPPGALLDYQYEGLSAEQIYHLLPDEPEQGRELPMADLVEPGEDGDNPFDKQEAERQLDEILIQAAMQTQMVEKSLGLPGSTPGEVLRYIDKLINPKIPWQRILQRYMTNFSKTGYSMRKPNRRFMPDFYMPSRNSQCTTDVLAYGDLSASVTQAEADAYLVEGWNLCKNLRPKSFKFIGFDTRLSPEIEISKLNDIRHAKLVAGGGTDIVPVIADIAKRKPTFAIVFSDGHFGCWESQAKNPRVPIIWIILNNKGFKAPYGKVIHYESEI